MPYTAVDLSTQILASYRWHQAVLSRNPPVKGLPSTHPMLEVKATCGTYARKPTWHVMLARERASAHALVSTAPHAVIAGGLHLLCPEGSCLLPAAGATAGSGMACCPTLASVLA